MAETFRPPQGVRNEAKKALEWIAEGKAGSGFTSTGRARAAQLARGDAVSADTILRMYSFLARHESDKQGKGFNAGDEGYPSAGRVAWAAWGGDPGFSWSSKIREQLSARAALLEGESMESRDDAMGLEIEKDLPSELTSLLADVVSFYFRAHGAHWNVKGSDFSEYHALFNSIYEDVYSSIDPIAENIRKIGAIAPFRLTEFSTMAKLKDANIGQDPLALARDLLTANDVVLDCIADAFDCATEYGQQGIANFLADRMDKHQFWKWQLTSSLGEEVTKPAADQVEEDDIDDVVAEIVAPTIEMNSSDDLENEERAAVARIGEGSFVSWNGPNGRARGKVEKVVTSGNAVSSDGFQIEATPDYPAFQIRVYEAKGNGWIPTDTIVVHRNDLLTIITPLPSPRSEEIEMEERKSRMMTAEHVTMDCEVRSLSTDESKLRIGGYAAQFNKEATGLSFREMIAPGAFTRTLQSGEPVYLLVNHDTDQLPLASTASGTMNLREDDTGLWMEADLDPSNPRAQELASAVSRGDVSKMSFAFTVEPGGDTRESGLRTLKDLNLFEVSVVTWPAYDATTVGMRTASTEDAEAEALELRKRMLELKLKFNNSKNR